MAYDIQTHLAPRGGNISDVEGIGAGFSGVGGADESDAYDPGKPFGGDRDANGNPTSKGFAGVGSGPAYVLYPFDEGDVRIPAALAAAFNVSVAAYDFPNYSYTFGGLGFGAMYFGKDMIGQDYGDWVIPGFYSDSSGGVDWIDKATADNLANANLFGVPDPATELGFLGTRTFAALLGPLPVWFYTVVPGLQVNAAGDTTFTEAADINYGTWPTTPLVAIACLPPDLRNLINDHVLQDNDVLGGDIFPHGDPVPASFACGIAYVTSADDGSGSSGWTLLAESDTDAAGSVTEEDYAAVAADWLGATLASCSAYVGVGHFLSDNGTTPTVITLHVFATKPGIGIHLDSGSAAHIETTTAPTGSFPFKPL